jgi:hypothetical protein
VRCFFLAIRLRRFLMTEPTGPRTSVGRIARDGRAGSRFIRHGSRPAHALPRPQPSGRLRLLLTGLLTGLATGPVDGPGRTEVVTTGHDRSAGDIAQRAPVISGQFELYGSGLRLCQLAWAGSSIGPQALLT